MSVLMASGSSAWRREAWLLSRDRSVWGWWCVALLLSALAVVAGLSEVQQQRATIERLVAADRADRDATWQQQTDWGSAAYYSFHLTYDPPSNFAFAALGRRDDTAWKHRVRLLALEGQIHERDAGHPLLALIGRFDFAFVAAYVLPLVLIVLLHDGQASERRAGRHAWLEAAAAPAPGSTAMPSLWTLRAALRSAGVCVAGLLPLWLGGAAAGTDGSTLLGATAAVLAYWLLWAVVCAAVAAWQQAGEVILAVLLALWLVVAVIVPAAGRWAVDRAVPLPSGAAITLLQREAVNGAWDLPKATTMDAFVRSHPQWADQRQVSRPFEWKWYFAFQQVGDERAAALSQAYTEGRRQRDRWAGWVAWLAPPALLERTLQHAAGTDLPAALAYEARVRAFHAQLRNFYYPRLFLGEAFTPEARQTLPAFQP